MKSKHFYLFLCCLLFCCLIVAGASPVFAAGFPWKQLTQQPDAWYQSDEAKETAQNVLSYQTKLGDWPKNIDTSQKRLEGDSEQHRGTFDNSATLGEIRFLARMYRLAPDPVYKEAVLKGIDHVLLSQYENGGWPQRYPVSPNSYERHITFNDDAMINIMNFLRDVEQSPDFAFVELSRREKIHDAFSRGIKCILACQVRQGGRLTVWCAQHDPETLQPAGARSYELPSLSGGESANIIRFLISLEDPTPEVVQAINAAAQWYEDSKITGIRQEIVDGDKKIFVDPEAPPLWARFYELETNRPFFCGRDGIVKYDISEIEAERRNGYSWYTTSGTKVAKDLAQWKEKLPARPNVIFFLVDDLGRMDIGAFNPNTFYETPNVDRIAQEGMRFTNAYSACNVCSPTRYSIMTGRYPTRSGITNYLAGDRSERFNPAPLTLFMSLEEETLGEAFREAGYRTVFLGKWHLGDLQEYGPDKQGFDIVSGDMRYVAPTIQGLALPEHPSIQQGDPIMIQKKTENITDDALFILETLKDQPFLLYFSFYQVHIPLGASPELIEKYNAKREKMGVVSEEFTDFIAEEQVHQTRNERKVRLKQDHPVYAGMVEHMDYCIGRVLRKLDELGLSDDTIIVFMSDNGGLSTAEGSPTSNRPFRTGKGWNYEGGIRVPMIVKWPKQVKPGSVSDVPVISTDFYPTLLEMAGIPAKPQQHLDGVSLVPLLTETGSIARDAIFWHYPHYSNQGGFPSSAVRMGDYKLIQRLEDGQVQLYNLKEEIGEERDLASQEPQRAKEMQQRLFRWYEETGAKFLQPKNGRVPWHPNDGGR